MSPPTNNTQSEPDADGWIISNAKDVIPEYIGPYRYKGRKLGSGGMGDVYLVADSRLDRDLALKLIHPHVNSRDAVRARREINILRSMDHDNIVHFVDEGLWQGQTYFVTEYVEGPSVNLLVEFLRNRKFPTVADLFASIQPNEMPILLGGPMGMLSFSDPAYLVAVRIAQQIAVALDYLHAQDIIHRDVKPSNILLKSNGRALLTDFGIARVDSKKEASDLTGNTFIGTERYAAPEQQMRGKIDARTDVYGLGAVLYELTTGTRFFYENPKPPIEISTEIPKDLNDIILKALSKDPEQRYSKTMQFAEALQTVLRSPQSRVPEQPDSMSVIAKPFRALTRLFNGRK